MIRHKFIIRLIKSYRNRKNDHIYFYLGTEKTGKSELDKFLKPYASEILEDISNGNIEPYNESS